MSNVILFDIDYTLFDSKKFRDAFLSKICQKIKGSEDQDFIERANNIYLETREKIGYHDHAIFLKNLLEEIPCTIPVEELEKIVTDPHLIQESFYPEVVDVMSTLTKKTGVTVGIFSGGRVDLQNKKLEPIRHFFSAEHIHIFEVKKDQLEKVLHKYKGSTVFLVDDVLEILSDAKKINSHIITVWIKQGRFAKNQEPVENFSPDREIDNIKEILKVVE